MDPPGDGEGEAGQADHHQVDDEAGDGYGEEFAENSKVIVAGPTGEDQTGELDGRNLGLIIHPLHDLEPGELVPHVMVDIWDVLPLSCSSFEGPGDRQQPDGGKVPQADLLYWDHQLHQRTETAGSQDYRPPGQAESETVGQADSLDR